MQTANLRSARPVTVLGTVMGVARHGQWFLHDIDATGPDGARISLQVAATTRHRGSVMVRWDPEGVADPRFVSARPWALYALAAIVVVGISVGIWFLLA